MGAIFSEQLRNLARAEEFHMSDFRRVLGAVALASALAAGCDSRGSAPAGGDVPREVNNPANPPAGSPNGRTPAAAEFRGEIHTGIAAIGGEHTGVELITDDGARVEVDPGEHRGAAESLDGKRVIVKGTMVKKGYVERGEVRVLKAESIKADGGA